MLLKECSSSSSFLSPSGLESTDGRGRPLREPGHPLAPDSAQDWEAALGKESALGPEDQAGLQPPLSHPGAGTHPQASASALSRERWGLWYPVPSAWGALLRNPIVIDSGSYQLILEILCSSERLASVTHTCLVWQEGEAWRENHREGHSLPKGNDLLKATQPTHPTRSPKPGQSLLQQEHQRMDLNL